MALKLKLTQFQNQKNTKLRELLVCMHCRPDPASTDITLSSFIHLIETVILNSDKCPTSLEYGCVVISGEDVALKV